MPNAARININIRASVAPVRHRGFLVCGDSDVGKLHIVHIKMLPGPRYLYAPHVVWRRVEFLRGLGPALIIFQFVNVRSETLETTYSASDAQHELTFYARQLSYWRWSIQEIIYFAQFAPCIRRCNI